MTTPLDWRAHLTEEERIDITKLDWAIENLRERAHRKTSARELIRRRVTRRVKARIKREKK